MRADRSAVVRSPLLVGTVLVVAGFAFATLVARLNLLVSFGLLFADGLVVGTRARARPEALLLGSIAGGIVADAIFVAIREPTTDPAPTVFVASLGSALGLALFGAAAFVTPGYLFGRAVARSGETPEWIDEPIVGAPRSIEVARANDVTRPPRDRAPVGARWYVISGCGLLVLVAIFFAWLLDGISRMGP